MLKYTRIRTAPATRVFIFTSSANIDFTITKFNKCFIILPQILNIVRHNIPKYITQEKARVDIPFAINSETCYSCNTV